jgi:hypothetical protein
LRILISCSVLAMAVVLLSWEVADNDKRIPRRWGIGSSTRES